jgi:hypothetical protein
MREGPAAQAERPQPVDEPTFARMGGKEEDAFAVGTSVAGRPPHRSGRADFPHPALTSGV